MSPRVPVSVEAVAEICRRYQVRKLSLFGSVLRDDFGPASDVDVLVEFQPSARVGLFKLQDLEGELQRFRVRPAPSAHGQMDGQQRASRVALHFGAHAAPDGLGYRQLVHSLWRTLPKRNRP